MAKSNVSNKLSSGLPAIPGNLHGANAEQYCTGVIAAAKGLTGAQRKHFQTFCLTLAKRRNPKSLRIAERTLCTEIVKATVAPASRSAAEAECAKL